MILCFLDISLLKSGNIYRCAEILTPKTMGCLRLVYHGGGGIPPPP